MGYSRTPKVIQKARLLLDEMVESNKDIEWVFIEPSKVAYVIWEAIKYSIVSKKEEYKKYTALANKFKIKIIKPNIVKAELREVSAITPDGVVVRGIDDVLEVIGAIINYKRIKLIFPEFKFKNDTEIEILKNWCNNNSYHHYWNNNTLVVEKKDE